MKLQDLYSSLKATGFPVAYSHFNEAQEPPFICYLVINSANFHADDQVYKKIDRVEIELYTDKKDLEAEAKLENALESINLLYQTSENYIDSERLFQKIYEVWVV